jgi:dihydrofolate reductase
MARNKENRMRRVIVQELVSVDGFAAGPDGGLDFFESVTDYSEVDRENLEILQAVDTILLGAATYRMFVDYWPTAKGEVVADAVNTIPKLVFSSTLEQAPWGSWAAAEVVGGPAADTVSERKRRPGGDLMVWGSLSLAQTLLGAGLVDEIQLRVIPVAIGRGRPLFPQDVGTLGLNLLEAKPYRSGIVSLRYQTG